MTRWNRVVVGVDGSEGSRRALTWAAEEAREHQADLQVVAAWQVPVPAVGMGFAAYPWPEGADPRTLAEEELRQTVTDVLGDDPGVPVDTGVVEGHPAQVLIDAARSGDLLVVGCRGHGGFAGMLLGSVSQHVAAHSPCPVTVIR